jgi:ankyrin repeat protein
MVKPRAQGKKKPVATPEQPAMGKSFNSRYVREPDKIIDVKTGRTVLMDAIMTGDSDMIVRLLSAHASPNKADKSGRTAMHYAAEKGDTAAIALLAKHGAMANPRDNQLETPLFDALMSPEPVATLRALHAIGANPDIISRTGRIPLHNAAEKSDALTNAWLLSKTQAPDRQDNKGMSPLHLAVRDNNPAVVQAFLFERANVMTANKSGETVLHLAALRKTGRMEMLGVLLQSQAALLVNALDINKKSPLHLAIKNKDHVLAAAFIELGANINRACKAGLTPLHEAVIVGDMKMIKMLCAEGADIARLPPHGAESPLSTAIKVWNEAAMVKFLLDAGANPSLADSGGRTPLMIAASCNNDAMIDLLLKAGADATAVDNHKENALHYSGGRVLRDTVDKLIKAGADLNARETKNNRTPLHMMLYNNHPMQASWFLDAGADPNIGDKANIMPLHMAVNTQSLSLLAKLLEKGADPNLRDLHRGLSPLHLCAQSGLHRHALLLLEKGADPNIVNDYNRTPLHLCLLSGDPSIETIKHLLAYGANPLKEDKGEVSPLDVARMNNHKGAQELFKRVLSGKGPIPPPKKPPPAQPPWWHMG